MYPLITRVETKNFSHAGKASAGTTLGLRWQAAIRNLAQEETAASYLTRRKNPCPRCISCHMHTYRHRPQ
jgi:hypothetical protein